MPTKPRRFSMAQAVGAVVVITVAVGALAFNFAQDRKVNVGTAKAWEIQGPPCPTLTEAQFTAQHFTAKKTFDYDGITIGRAAGDASCSDVKASGGKGLATDKVCQFTSPVTLTVATKGGSYYFAPDVGHPASLMIHDGVPRCVLASNFTLQNEN